MTVQPLKGMEVQEKEEKYEKHMGKRDKKKNVTC